MKQIKDLERGDKIYVSTYDFENIQELEVHKVEYIKQEERTFANYYDDTYIVQVNKIKVYCNNYKELTINLDSVKNDGYDLYPLNGTYEFISTDKSRAVNYILNNLQTKKEKLEKDKIEIDKQINELNDKINRLNL